MLTGELWLVKVNRGLTKVFCLADDDAT